MTPPTNLPTADPAPRGVSRALGRRGFLGAAGLLAATGLPAVLPARGAVSDDPFTLGVASGDPLPTAVVIWTRLAPDPARRTGGMPDQNVPVEWKVATDEQFRHVVRSGTATARPDYVHSVHVDVRGLQPSAEYFYQFRQGRHTSPVGRTRTAPQTGSALRSLKFLVASCQSYPNGYYTAYGHVADEDAAFLLFLGDYIYDSTGTSPYGRNHEPNSLVITLDDFRLRYALYKTDPTLQEAHAALPWMIMEDDHDVRNNYGGTWDRYGDSRDDVLVRRANAYRAQWEHAPLRQAQFPQGPDYPLYRRFSYGDLATVSILDERQFRSDPPTGCDVGETDGGYCPSQLDPSRSMLGAEQLGWVLDGLSRSRTHWNVIGNPVFFTQRDHDPDPEVRSFNVDTWDGFVADRQKILDHIVEHKIDNMVLVTGDSHQNWVQNTPPNFRDWDARPVATEYLGTSITSGGERTPVELYHPDPVQNPQLLFENNGHGYLACTLTKDLWQTDYRVVDTVAAPTSPIRTMCRWATENRNPGAQLVSKGS